MEDGQVCHYLANALLTGLISNFLLIVVAYLVIRGAWKIYGISKLHKKGGPYFRKLLEGRGGAGFAIGALSLLVTIAAFFFPWYDVSATLSGAPPGSSPVQLMYIDGLRGLNVTLFSGNGTSVGGLTNVVAAHIPLAALFAVGIPLLILDFVGVTKGVSLGRRFIDSGIILIFGVGLILAFVALLPSSVPATSSLLGGNPVPASGTQLLTSIAATPWGGSSAFGGYSVTWGFGTGVYLLIVAAVFAVIGGEVMSTVGDLRPPATPVNEETAEPTRRLAAIMFTDIVGYTALTQKDESRAMSLLKKHRKVIRPIFPKHSGREVKTIGDAFLVEFASALEATECAVEMQKTLHDLKEPEEDKLKLKIGIHVGDVIHQAGDVLGDAVNIASRIEPLAKGGGIVISEQVYDQIHNKVPYELVKLDPTALKNVSFQIDTYRVILPWEEKTSASA